jgi:hypothetical protein
MHSQGANPERARLATGWQLRDAHAGLPRTITGVMKGHAVGEIPPGLVSEARLGTPTFTYEIMID